MSMMGWAIIAVVAVIAWMVSANIDGPIVYVVITILAAWLAYKYVRSHMTMGGT